MPTGKRILLIRNDKLGDFMLAWPAFALLKTNLPKAHLAALVPAYTESLAKACPYIDEVILDPKLKGDWKNGQALAKLLKPKKFDAVITLFSRFDTGYAVWSAGISERYAPATKLAQVFYNRRIAQHRSRSEKPEYEYNMDLVRAFLASEGLKKVKEVEPPYFSFKPTDAKKVKQKFLKKHKIAATKQLVFVHTGHGGSASNLSVLQYAELIKFLAASKKLHFVLTAGPGEEGPTHRLSHMLGKIPHAVHESDTGLLDFARHLQSAATFISGSTGPLHLAAALGVPTAGFYPRRRSSTALRWQTVNPEKERLSFTPPESAAESDMTRIDIKAAAAAIAKRLL